MEQQLVPYEALLFVPATHALVLAPHPDDEVFGCGGAIAACVVAGVPVDVLILTDGAGQGQAEIRQAESRAAAAVLGYGELVFWGLPDRELRPDQTLLARLVAHIVALDADLLYAPSPWEVHPDHRHTAQLAIQAARETGVRIAFYEVGSPLRPNLLLDITAHAEVKLRAMRCFGSQLACQAYDHQIEALNQYRCYTLPPAVASAEAYLMLTPAELSMLLPRLLAAFPVTLGSGTDNTFSASDPLVSVVIRSLDRHTLQQALDTVALQTYPVIEVVVVAASPAHQALPQRCGPFALRLIDLKRSLGRSEAANQGLIQARGEYILLFDDDDLLLPSHIARLVHTLRQQPHCLAAYSGVALAGPRGEPLGQTLDLPFDAIRQLSGNLTPIHAVLFDRKLLDLGCRFDESLNLLEDWDFWLQIATHTVFAHVPGISAIYRIHSSSGVHTDSGPEGQPSRLIYNKWQRHWNSDQISQLMQRVWSHTDMQRRLEDLQRQAESNARTSQQTIDEMLSLNQALHQSTAMLQETNHQRSEQLALLQQTTQQTMDDNKRLSESVTYLGDLAANRATELTALRASSSWRLTAPLRNLFTWVRSVR